LSFDSTHFVFGVLPKHTHAVPQSPVGKPSAWVAVEVSPALGFIRLLKRGADFLKTAENCFVILLGTIILAKQVDGSIHPRPFAY